MRNPVVAGGSAAIGGRVASGIGLVNIVAMIWCPKSLVYSAGISIIDLRPTDNIQLTAGERNYESALHCQVLSQAAGKGQLRVSAESRSSLSTDSRNTFPSSAATTPDSAATTGLAYLPGEGSAAILPSMPPNSRRVRWLSAAAASNSGRVSPGDRRFTSRCCKLPRRESVRCCSINSPNPSRSSSSRTKIRPPSEVTRDPWKSILRETLKES
jgi:hypothetical protein